MGEVVPHVGKGADGSSERGTGLEAQCLPQRRGPGRELHPVAEVEAVLQPSGHVPTDLPKMDLADLLLPGTRQAVEPSVPEVAGHEGRKRDLKDRKSTR